MGLIKYGPLGQEIAGSVGGVTFARVYGAKIARGWRKPTQPNSPYQMTQRNLHTQASQRWFSILCAADRANWDGYALTCPFVNTLGDTYHLKGFNLFVRNATIYYQMGANWLTAPPTLDGFPYSYLVEYYLTHATGNFGVQSITPALAPDDLIRLSVHALSKSTRNQLTPSRHALYVVVDTDVLPLFLYTYPGTMPGAAGTIKACTRHYVIDSYQRISTPVTTFTNST